MLFSLGSRRSQVRPPLTGAPSPAAPRIGLALGGGSARGWAHIGVIQELAAQGIDVDIYAGTSIGAVVGACAAAGKLQALETFARGLNRRRVLGLMDLSFGGTGLIGGARLKRRLARELGGLVIEELPKPFAACATELGSGREVCLAKGDVVQAIRASYALPGIFEPLLIDGRWLFDGAMSNPVPVSVCRALGADLVIAVNLTSDITGRPADTEASLSPGALDPALDPTLEALDEIAEREAVDSEDREPKNREPKNRESKNIEPKNIEPKPRRGRMRRLMLVRRRLFTRRPNGAPGIASVVVGAFSIAQERISRSRLALDPPDVMIHARLTTVGLFDFHRAAALIEHGRLVARQAMPSIDARLAALGRQRGRVAAGAAQ